MQDLPPIIPDDAEALTKAIMVLGHRIQNVDISKKLRKQLVELLGMCPESMEQAMRYKRTLKQIAKWEAEGEGLLTEETPEMAQKARNEERQAGLSVGSKAAAERQRRMRVVARFQKTT